MSTHKYKFYSLKLLLWFVLSPFLVVSALVFEHRAQAQTAWSPPLILFETKGTVSRSIVIADPEGVVHVFVEFEEQENTSGDSTRALIYTRRHGNSWSRPIDVLVSPDGSQVVGATVTLDLQGYLHVVWLGGAFGHVYYSRAHVTRAGTGRGWTPPKVLSDDQSLGSDIFASKDGLLHFVYARRGGNVFYRQSSDGGQRWTSPVVISNVDGFQSATAGPRIVADENGRLHVVWTQLKLPEGWPPLGAYYSRSTDGGKTWSFALQVAGINYGQINLATMGTDKVYLIWNSVVTIGERVFQWSGDGGQTWTAPQKITRRKMGGFSGYSAAAFDSSGVLHLVTTAEGPDTPSGGGIFYLAWNKSSWTDTFYISRGTVGTKSVEAPWIALGNGNHLHVVYEDDFQRIWYTDRLVNAPAVPRQAVPTPVVTATNTPKPVPTQSAKTATKEPTRVATLPNDSVGSTTDSPMTPLLVGIIPVILLIAAIAMLRTFQHQR